MTPITTFRGEWWALSNFYWVPVVYEGDMHPTLEHAYQAAKTFDQDARHEIRLATSPVAAKAHGQRVRRRPDWDDVKIAIMLALLEDKFQDPYCREVLVKTGDRHLIEGNTWGDRFWGESPVGRGENWLGRLLMAVRGDPVMEFPDTLARRLTEQLMADLHATLTHACPSDATGLYNRVYSKVYAYFDALTGEGTPYPPQAPPPMVLLAPPEVPDGPAPGLNQVRRTFLASTQRRRYGRRR